ncbi:hypothetical protein E2C01_085217 [Portunus trituberculatus]|uniref:Uncharacterized protein n=1 Tax=Portunus trituberculatus TaxID=210409 RepID=A0A5B7IXA6_PORTR|nr:hypothetical protein [Portunus trituberculatus]
MTHCPKTNAFITRRHATHRKPILKMSLIGRMPRHYSLMRLVRLICLARSGSDDFNYRKI